MQSMHHDPQHLLPGPIRGACVFGYSSRSPLSGPGLHHVRAQDLALTSFAFGTPSCVWGPCSVWGTQELSVTCIERTSTSATEVHYTSFRTLIISSAAICTNAGVAALLSTPAKLHSAVSCNANLTNQPVSLAEPFTDIIDRYRYARHYGKGDLSNIHRRWINTGFSCVARDPSALRVLAGADPPSLRLHKVSVMYLRIGRVAALLTAGFSNLPRTRTHVGAVMRSDDICACSARFRCEIELHLVVV
jgi:hypothetical protein